MIRVHVTGTLWNLSSHHSLKQPLLDQVINDVVQIVLAPYAAELRHNGLHSAYSRQSGLLQSFVNCSGLVRNLSSHSDAARRRLRDADGLIGPYSFWIINERSGNAIINILDEKFQIRFVTSLKLSALWLETPTVKASKALYVL